MEADTLDYYWSVTYVAVTLIFEALFGGIGILIVSTLTFGMLFSVYVRVSKLSADIQLIKDKLGIVNIKNLEDIQNMNMKNDDIEKELEEYHVDKGKN